jgi:hypothetical protein
MRRGRLVPGYGALDDPDGSDQTTAWEWAQMMLSQRHVSTKRPATCRCLMPLVYTHAQRRADIERHASLA